MGEFYNPDEWKMGDPYINSVDPFWATHSFPMRYPTSLDRQAAEVASRLSPPHHSLTPTFSQFDRYIPLNPGEITQVSMEQSGNLDFQVPMADDQPLIPSQSGLLESSNQPSAHYTPLTALRLNPISAGDPPGPRQTYPGSTAPGANTGYENTLQTADAILNRRNTYMETTAPAVTSGQNKAAPREKTLKITPLNRELTLYFERVAKKIWLLEELHQQRRDPVAEGLEGPIIFGPRTNRAYVKVTYGGKECLPSAKSQTERNNFLKGQLAAIGRPIYPMYCFLTDDDVYSKGDCAHGRGFKFSGKRPAVIMIHVVNKQQCTLYKTHPDLVRFAEWCRDI
ncbi:hypothetical protein BT69DRAFT_607909 [Atractiella rhizophila]|nr:hypothetical protein BT69DRAFT_607909 [Atractiella rhizophila]